ncbi:DUF1461 domain-containing protein [Candidatus Woesearchaeota archaeon]|nr:DUF1461 domain-containing protein [Candidatus Woesearchaeota archaeon]
MKFAKISKFLLITITPLLLFSLILNFVGFDDAFFNEKFSEYGVQQNVPKAVSLNENVLKFMTGKSDDLPDEFNEREKRHLHDVRSLLRTASLTLYLLITLYIVLLAYSASMLKDRSIVIDFIGKILIFGGLFTILFSATLFLFISLDFIMAFDFFHRLFFENGTYVFNPAEEIIVNLYPEQLFMEIGLRITKLVSLVSVVFILAGLMLSFKLKIKKNK